MILGQLNEEEGRKKMSGILAFMQPKGPQTKYNNVILGSFKLMELMLSLICTTTHVYSYMNHRINMPHITIFCGTYAGYAIVSVGMFMGYLVRYRATPEMDLFYCFLGGLLYNIAAIMSMRIAQTHAYLQDNEGEFYVDMSFLYRCAAHSILSTIAGMVYWIDFFINLDIWWGVRRRHRCKLLSMIGEMDDFSPKKRRKTAITEEDELELHCVCLELAYHFRDLFLLLWKKETYTRIFRIKGSEKEYDIEDFLQMAAEQEKRNSMLGNEASIMRRRTMLLSS